MSARRPGAVRPLAPLALVVPLLLVPLLLAPLALAAPGTGAPTAPGAAAEGPAYSATKTLSRSIVVEGESFVIDEREVTVTASRTTELRGRERIQIAWSGARPTGGRAASPYGELGLQQEYPVVILQCRGLDDPSLPAAQQLSPETCWTSSRMQRTQAVDESAAVWRHDVHATDAQRAPKSGLDPVPAECNDPATMSTRITPFRAAGGTVHASCTAETMAPEAAVGAAFPPAEMAAFTDADGTGAVKFEVRSAVENESLGCSDTVACSVVVIPIEGISCLDDDPECSKAGRFLPGSSNFANEGVDPAVSPAYWWSESNWRGRFSIPLEFGLPPDACDVLDSRAPTAFYGSELMGQASTQWAPAYCLDKKRFKFQHNKMADAAGFNLAENGGAAAAFVSSRHEPKGEDPVAYAPTAVTGFGIAYVIDRPDNAGEVTSLRLNARLLAKLLTQSYAASERGRAHPGMSANPLSINLDPEFAALNPGLDTTAREAAATVLSLSGGSDVLDTLTRYLAADADAMAFVAGKPDPWGMVVNPSYKKISLPREEWPLLDDFVAPSELECYKANPAPYFTQVAAPITSLQKIAEAVLDAWPNVQTKCDRATTSDPWKIGRVDRQGVGSRFMLGIVSTGDAARLGLNLAQLRTRGTTYVAPTDATLARALRVAKPSRSGTEPFTLDMADVLKAGGYPGTMVVYTAARTAHLDAADAAKVAQFIQVATGEGQRRGYGNGQLPAGYLPIVKGGATGPLLAQARTVAEAVAAQEGEEPEEGPGQGPGPGGSSTPAGGTATTPVEVPSTETVTEEGEGKPARPTPTGPPEPVAMPATTSVSAQPTGRLIPALLAVAFLGSLVAAGVQVAQVLRRGR